MQNNEIVLVGADLSVDAGPEVMVELSVDVGRGMMVVCGLLSQKQTFLVINSADEVRTLSEHRTREQVPAAEDPAVCLVLASSARVIIGLCFLDFRV